MVKLLPLIKVDVRRLTPAQGTFSTAALYDFDAAAVRDALDALCAPQVIFKLAHPLGEFDSSEEFYTGAIEPLKRAWPDLERRDNIVIAGQTAEGADWVACCGYYTGTFTSQWLDIPPTGHQVAIRFHEFYQFENDQLVQMQSQWDIPEVMMQAGAWPMAPSLAREWQVPGPALQNGLSSDPYDAQHSERSCQHVVDMLEDLCRHPAQGGPELMQLKKYWHSKMIWALVDLLDLWRQLGVDVFARLREFNKARNMRPITLSDGLSS